MPAPFTWDNPANLTWDSAGLTWDSSTTTYKVMPNDNRISAEVTAANKTAILEKLTEIQALLPKGEDGKEKPGELNWVHSIAVDAKGDVYLGDIIGKRVQKFTRR